MKQRNIIILLFVALLLGFVSPVASAAKVVVTAQAQEQIAQTLTRIVSSEIKGVSVKVNSISLKGGKVKVYTSVAMSYYPVREDNLAAMCDSIRLYLPSNLSNKKIDIISEGHSLEEYIPLYYRNSPKGVKPFVNASEGGQLVRPERLYSITRGLAGRHIALWQSHGYYFNNKKNDWDWQRSLLWQTVEDLYTQSYVLPYLVPMLEKAGATVMLPRERDFQTQEILVDNDGEGYSEKIGKYNWQAIEGGFAHLQQHYLTGQNPFTHGSNRVTRTVTGGDRLSLARWSASFAKSGEYAVYVSYKSFPDSADGALYVINHAGGQSRVRVNQLIGGGTWIYLGTYRFNAGEQRVVVTLSNSFSQEGKVVSADAVKIGGGYGNIARTVCDSLRVAGADYTPITSGKPRFCEGARYWLQWAGFNEDVYGRYNDCDDYKEDYTSRAEWVNALMGGSDKLPKSEGLGIPIDLTLAFHTDAGDTGNDATIGTLGIFCTKDNRGKFEDGVKRYRSRDLTDLIMTQLCDDIRRTYEPQWRRRGMWNKSYYEARVPSTPTMLLELLSHQNLADMRLGHDPNFKFLVSRAIYKAVLRHISAQYNVPYCVSPLPVSDFATAPTGGGDVCLSWNMTADSLESTAKPTSYIVYTRIGDGGFDNGKVVTDNRLIVNQKPDIIYSYRVTAVNAGGESFPSEILSVCQLSEAKTTTMIINGFDRVAAPECREDGFHNEYDSGVAYLQDVAFIGEQRNFVRPSRGEKREVFAFGASCSNEAGKVVGGNSFDYPYLHGQSIVKAGSSFYSVSASAVAKGLVDLSGYNLVDLILGKQRTTVVGRGVTEPKYTCFTPALQEAITNYLKSNGALIVSGAYWPSDLLSNSQLKESVDFAKSMLRVNFGGSSVSKSSYVTTQSRAAERLSNRTYNFCRDYRPDYYNVNSVDGLIPTSGASVMMKYPDSGIAAAVASKDNGYATFVMSFPFESITDSQSRDNLMLEIINYLIPNL